MKALVLSQPGSYSVNDLPIPSIDSQSVLLKVHSVGLCGSDVRVLKHGSPRMRYPTIPGHEISGEVVKVGKRVNGYRVKDRVAVGCFLEDVKGMERDLGVGYQISGGFTQYMVLSPLVLKHGPVVKVRSRLSFDEAVLAEPLAAVIKAFERVRFKKGNSILIFGAGPIGTMMAAVAQSQKASNVVVVGKSNDKLKASKRCRAKTLILADKRKTIQSALKLNKGVGYHVVMVACGDNEAQEMSVEVAGHQGRINFFGVLPKSNPLISIRGNEIHYKELEITGIHGAPPSYYRKAVQLLEKREISLKSLISHHFPLINIREAIDAMNLPNRQKILVHPHG